MSVKLLLTIASRRAVNRPPNETGPFIARQTKMPVATTPATSAIAVTRKAILAGRLIKRVPFQRPAERNLRSLPGCPGR